MIYSYESNNRLKQGDICCNLPMITSKEMSVAESEESWDAYTNALKNEETIDFQMVVIPTPVTGVILSQTCDILPRSNLIFSRLLPLPRKERPKKENKITKYIQDIIRNDTRRHYFPNPDNGRSITKEDGPYFTNFNEIFILPSDLILKNLDIFWKARLSMEARVVLCEKIQKYFTRLAFDDVIFFTMEEIKLYIKYNKVNPEDIKNVLRRIGRENEISGIFEI